MHLPNHKQIVPIVSDNPNNSIDVIERYYQDSEVALRIVMMNLNFLPGIKL